MYTGYNYLDCDGKFKVCFEDVDSLVGGVCYFL